MKEIIAGYLKVNKLIFSLLLVYGVLLLLNAIGISVWLPSCPFSTYLGIECFGCGTNRAIIALMNLEPEKAWNFNPLIFLYLPMIVFWISFSLYKYSKKQTYF